MIKQSRLSMILSIYVSLSFPISIAFGEDPQEAAAYPLQEEESLPDGVTHEQATPLDESDDNEEPESASELPQPDPRMSTMNMPAQAPFGASQRGMPPVVNPANASFSDRRFRFGTLFDVGFGVEIGEADDFDRKIDDILDAFERLEDQVEEFSGPRPSDEEIEDFLSELNLFEDDANELVRDLTDKAYLKLTGSASAPFVPIAIRSNMLRGTFTINADVIVEARAAVESANDAFDIGLQGVAAGEIDRFEMDEDVPVVVLTDGTERRIEPTDDAGVAVQGGYVGRVGGGYSREVWKNDRGRIHAGTSLNFYRATLVRGGVLLNDDDFEDTARDEFEDNQETSSGFGIDLGAAWVSRWYSAGATLRNINQPSFDYPDTSESAFFTANPQARRNGSSWTMERQLTLEGAVYTPNRRWLASGALDLNSARDTTGDNYKWASVLGSYEPRRSWIPSPRAGLRANLVGEKLTYVTGGVSFFRALHLDVSSTLDTSTIDGTSLPRGFQANLALGRRF